MFCMAGHTVELTAFSWIFSSGNFVKDYFKQSEKKEKEKEREMKMRRTRRRSGEEEKEEKEQGGEWERGKEEKWPASRLYKISTSLPTGPSTGLYTMLGLRKQGMNEGMNEGKHERMDFVWYVCLKLKTRLWLSFLSFPRSAQAMCVGWSPTNFSNNNQMHIQTETCKRV